MLKSHRESKNGQRRNPFPAQKPEASLEKVLGRKVDLVTPEALRKELREQILREAIHAAWELEDARAAENI